MNINLTPYITAQEHSVLHLLDYTSDIDIPNKERI